LERSAFEEVASTSRVKGAKNKKKKKRLPEKNHLRAGGRLSGEYQGNLLGTGQEKGRDKSTGERETSDREKKGKKEKGEKNRHRAARKSRALPKKKKKKKREGPLGNTSPMPGGRAAPQGCERKSSSKERGGHGKRALRQKIFPDHFQKRK